METPRVRFVGLDIMRCVAALMVMWFHLTDWITTRSNFEPYSFPEIDDTSRYGWVGVHLFFLISGIVIAQSAHGRDAKGFAASRFWRLFPTALICASISAAVIASGMTWLATDHTLERFLRSVLFVPYGPWVDGVYWTLAVEVSFYAAIAGLMLFRPTRARYEVVFIGFAIVVACAWYAQEFVLARFMSRRTGEILLLYHAPIFAIGVLIARAWRDRWTLPRLAAIAFLGYPALLVIYNTDHRDGVVPPLIWLTLLGVTLLAPYWERTLPQRWRGRIATLSISTYPLYLLHAVGGSAVLLICAKLGLDRFVALGVTIVITVGVSLLIGAIIEPALRRSMQMSLRTRMLPTRTGL